MESYYPLTRDVQLLILRPLSNIDLVALSQVSKYWHNLIRSASFIPYCYTANALDMHYGFRRHSPGARACDCDCFFCSQLAKVRDCAPKEIIRIIKSTVGPYHDRWQEYIHPDDHEAADLISKKLKDLPGALVTEPDIQFSEEFARLIRYLQKNNHQFIPRSDYQERHQSTIQFSSLGLPKNDDPNRNFSVMFPIYGTLLLLNFGAENIQYCCDKNHPYYDHLLIKKFKQNLQGLQITLHKFSLKFFLEQVDQWREEFFNIKMSSCFGSI